ncbi:HAMP domain-containing sensor histidine kinase [Variovorax sp. OV329]|uniref:sensor histidine kinase n=1 Tax=Variovorax sp. OV329 TaxID=1882825 RepID=UPI0008E8AADD|nr:HAMP domain-containing sensor histidine kinase [Variovorax sp. OV329]SFM75053.1 Signal transduction histidine kinase [Variovorax sp. OV329]
MRSLRGQLIYFWILLISVCTALAVVMVTLYRSSAGAQVAEGRAVAEQSCRAIAARYARSVPVAGPDRPQLDLLQVLLQLVLIETPHVEGGIWQRNDGMLAYAYPTYEGSGVKRDVPSAEQPLIIELAQQAARTRQMQTDVVRGSREALIVSACPLAASGNDLAAWTMTRTHAGALAAQNSLRTGLGVLMALVLASGLWLGWILLRGLRHVQRLEHRLAQAQGDEVPELDRTGVRELDRIVDGFNRYRLRFEEARAGLREAAQQRQRDQRLAALGRMTSGIAHEIRNPIAAMRLKAENALAAPPERQGDALHAIVGQIDRLEGLVRSLLALVQPVTLAPQAVDLAAWLAERVAGAAGAAAGKGVAMDVRHAEPVQAGFDPVHLARAVDNLLANAVLHAPRGGRVVLEAVRDGGGALLIRVDDNGPGVPEALVPQLFEPFATGRADGTGLGLALAREVALAHGGELRYVPLHPGARFELEIPWRSY